MTKYSEDMLLPKVTNEIFLQSKDLNARVYFWEQLYKKYPNNYWCKVFKDKMENCSKEEILEMRRISFELEDKFYEALVNKIDLDGQEASELLDLFIKHMEFFHPFDEFFYEVFLEFCERSRGFNEKIPGIKKAIEKDPKFLKNNPVMGLISEEYSDIIYNILQKNKETILGR